MSDEIELIKQRLDIVELIREYLTLQKAGSANWKARCPFHNEKTPSFFVSKERQMWHCFGCGEGGDHFSFIQKLEGLDFPEALELLAQKAGVVLERRRPVPGASDDKRRILDVLDLAAKFYHVVLRDHEAATAARAYLDKRGVTSEDRENFKLGFAPAAWETLANFFKQKGVAERDALAAGLVVRSDRGTGVYDRFRGRILFPISDVRGQIVGFTGRILDPDAKEAKYVNTPETLVYKKSAVLYGLDRARQAIRQADAALLVEGNMDVIACHRVGLTQAVAASGTALTDEQLVLLGRFTKNLVLCFDVDAAGETAAARGIDLALQRGFAVRVARLDPAVAKDPDEAITKDPDIMKKAVRDAVHIMEYHIGRALAGRDLGSVENRNAVAHRVLAEIVKLPDPIERDLWTQKLAALVQVKMEILLNVGAAFRPPIASAGNLKVAPTSATPTSRDDLLAEEFLALLSVRPELIRSAVERVRPDMLQGAEWPALYNSIISGEDVGSSGATRRVILRGEKDFKDLGARDADAALHRYSDLIRAGHSARKRMELERLMRDAEASGDRARVEDLMKEYVVWQKSP